MHLGEDGPSRFIIAFIGSSRGVLSVALVVLSMLRLTATRPSSPAGCIQVSEATHQLLSDYTFQPTGGVEVKGKVRGWALMG